MTIVPPPTPTVCTELTCPHHGEANRAAAARAVLNVISSENEARD